MTLLPRMAAWCCGTLIIMLFCLGPAQAQLVLGVHPFKPATKLIPAFTPLIDYLSSTLGQPMVLEIAKDYQSHIDAIGQGEVDIAYMGPAPYVEMVEKYGRRPLLARQAIQGRPLFRGVIFVREDSPSRSLTDLQGKRFAFGEPHSTMSHLVPRYMLWQAGITGERLAEYQFLGNHINVALAVLAGDFDAGAVKEDVYLAYKAQGLRALARSEAMSDHVFITRHNLPEDLVRRLREALLRLDTAPQGAEILEAITPGVTKLVPVQDSDYDSLRRVLAKLKQLGVVPQ